MRREAGFSLIEMMVVLAIVSLAAGLVVVNAPGPSGQLANETDRLIRSLVAARDLALVENRTVMVEVTETGYATRVASRLGLDEHHVPPVLRRHIRPLLAQPDATEPGLLRCCPGNSRFERDDPVHEHQPLVLRNFPQLPFLHS